MTQTRHTGYGVGDPKIILAPTPIVVNRDPSNVNDLNYDIGTLWLNKPANTFWVFFGGNATTPWFPVSSTAANLTSLTVTGNASIGTSGSNTVAIANGTGTNSVSIAANAAGVNTVTVGSANGASGTLIQGGSSGITLNAAGLVSVTPALVSSASTPAVLNARVGQATFTGFTTAAAATQVFVVTNSIITATSVILATVANLGSNDAQMTLQRVQPGSGTVSFTVLNDGAAALNGNVQINFWVLT